LTHQLREIFCDLNAVATENSHRRTKGSFAGLKRKVLTPEQAVGMRFSFYGGADEDEHGQPADIIFNGTVVMDDERGYLAVVDINGIYWRPKTAQS